MKITEKEFNVLTGETTITERDETVQEQTAREAAEAEAVERLTAETTRAATRAALLTRLGITEEEARILLGGN